jgi:DNA-binding FadR family transcriptional regulator
VEVRPRTGIRPLPYSFKPAVRQSLAFGISIDPELVHTYSDLRNHLEAAYFDQAVALLTADDQQALRALVASAFSKLRGQPAQIPHGEHRELHMLIYSRLNNVFVNGLLEAYWEMYEAVGLNVYTDLRYLERVWQYHPRMVDAICAGDIAGGRAALLEHINLLDQRSKPLPRQQFE